MNTNTNATANATGMTDYGKRKLNGLLKVYLAKNSEKNALANELKPVGTDIKTIMGEAGMTLYVGGGIKATLTETHGRELDPVAIAKLLGGTIPDSCYKPTTSVRLNVKSA